MLPGQTEHPGGYQEERVFLYDDRIRAALGGLLVPSALLIGRPPSWAGGTMQGAAGGASACSQSLFSFDSMNTGFF